MCVCASAHVRVGACVRACVGYVLKWVMRGSSVCRGGGEGISPIYYLLILNSGPQTLGSVCLGNTALSP